MSGKQLKKPQTKPQQQDKDLEQIDQRVMKTAVEEAVVSVMQQSEFSGPIPHPDILKGYDAIVPGAAERIIRMAEKQSEHRQSMEKTIVEAEIRDSNKGINCAFILGLGGMISGVIIVYLVPSSAGAIAGSLLGVTGLGSIVASFLKTTRIGKDEKKSE